MAVGVAPGIAQGAANPDPGLRGALLGQVAWTTDAQQPLTTTLQLTLRNTAPQAVAVLVWGTPLEGAWFGRFATVRRNGRGLPYQGAMKKRGDPLAEHYLRLAPGASHAATVDVAQAFDLSQPGRYTVQLAWQWVDALWADRTPWPRPLGQHQALPGPTVPALTFTRP